MKKFKISFIDGANFMLSAYDYSIDDRVIFFSNENDETVSIISIQNLKFIEVI